MAYTYDPIFAADPSNAANVAANASIIIFDPADAGKAPITITDVTGAALPNPITVNKNGFGPAFQHATLDRVGWFGAGFTGYFTSYEGMKAVAVEAEAAAQAAQAAAETAGVDAAAEASAALSSAVADAASAQAAAASSAALVGAPADTAVQTLINSSGSATKTALNAAIASVPAIKIDAIRSPRPLVVFTFDDSRKEDITVIKPILDGKSVKGSFACISGTVGNGGTVLSWAEVRQLRDEGHEILDHSSTHVTLASADATLVAAEIDASKARFATNGVYPEGFVWPFSSSNTLARAAARRNYKFALGGAAGSTMPFHTYAIKRAPLTDATTLASLKTLVDNAVTNNELLIFLSHSTTELTGAGRVTLADLIDYIKSLNVQIVTAAEAFRQVGNIVDTGDLPGGVDFTVVDGLGKLKASGGAVVVAGPNNPTAAQAQTTYAPGVITYQRVNGPGNTDWPDPGSVGIIMTNRLDTASYQYTVQQFISAANVVYTRHPTSDTTWGPWFAPGGAVMLANNATAPTTNPDTFATGKVTYAYVSSPNNTPATGWPLTGGAATVITIRTGTDTTAQYVSQQFIGPDGTTFTRRAASNTTWGAWSGAGSMGSSATAPDLVVTAFPVGTSVMVVPNPGSTGPGGNPGALITHRPTATGYGYATQEFHVYQGGAMYRRMAMDATTWSAWKIVTLT